MSAKMIVFIVTSISQFFFTCGLLGLIEGWDVCVNPSAGKSAMETSTVGGVCICCSGYDGGDRAEITEIKVL